MTGADRKAYAERVVRWWAPGQLRLRSEPQHDAAGEAATQEQIFAALLLAVLTFAAFLHGAYYATEARWVALMLAGLGVAVWIPPTTRRRSIGSIQRWFVGAQLAFLLALGVDVARHGVGAGEQLMAWILVGGAGAYLVGAFGVADDELLLIVITAVGVVVAATAIIGVVFHLVPWALHSTFWRGASTVTYPNAAGALIVLALPASIVLRARSETSASAVGVWVLLTGVIATVSLGAALGACVLLLALRRSADLVRHLAWPAAAAAVTGCALIPSIIDRNSTAILPLAVIPLSLVLCIRRSPERIPRLALVSGLQGLVVLVAAVRVAYPRMLHVDQLTRVHEWGVALHVFENHPLFGAGLGRLNIMVHSPLSTVVSSRFAHNEYLQSLAELGLVGGALVFGGIVLIALGCFHDRCDRLRSESIAGGAALTAFAAQSAFDFLWHVPLLVFLVAVWLAIIVRGKDPGNRLVDSATRTNATEVST